MRVVSGMYYKNIQNQTSKSNERLFDVNKQISSGLKIQYAKDDVGIFTETMRLDNEIATLGQIKKSVESGYKISNQTDTLLNEFQTTMDRTRVLLLQASNGSQSEASQDAIANELRGIEGHFKNLSNTSINGQYLFSGSATDVKPISADGTYMGNDLSMNSFVGAGVEQQHNLSGADLFLGEELSVKKEITTNTPQFNLVTRYPDFTNVEIDGPLEYITASSTVRELMGDIDNDIINSYKSHFYVRGTKSDGTSFDEHIEMKESESVDDLLTRVGNMFGNTSHVDVVNVTLNSSGQIVVQDKMSGSSKLDFHMVGAIDYDMTDGNDAADISDAVYGANIGKIDNLQFGETNFDSIIKGVSNAANTNLFVKNFVQSPFEISNNYQPVLKTAEFEMSGSVGLLDTLTLTVNDGVVPSYTQGFDTDIQTTYEALQAQIEADGNFSVILDVDNNIFTLNSTVQGMANNVSIVTELENDNVAISTDTELTNSEISADIDSIIYDRTQFVKDGATLSSGTSHVLKSYNKSSLPYVELSQNAFATSSTKISDVADLQKEILPITDPKTYTLDGTVFNLVGKDVSGNAYDVHINLKNSVNGGSTFSFDTDGNGTYDDPMYDIFNMENPRV
ncbi:MAG: flagellar biosynthesis protein FlgL, partial [Sulfurimonas sp.]|nr:flagellar biosynthesis protein FlgL [Sulfurimonas sp.]